SVGAHAWLAITGLGFTAVLIPLLGLSSMILYKADYHQFFGRLGKIPGILLLFFLQLIVGPFGVIARLITLMHAISTPYLFGIPLPLFSTCAAAICFACCFRRDRLMRSLMWLTPVLLLCLASLVFFGILDGSTMNPVSLSPQESFWQGLVGGYNTMDLIAAFIFASLILPHFQEETMKSPDHSMLQRMLMPGVIDATLLFFSYLGLCLISAYHGGALDTSAPEQILGAIAEKLLGPVGAIIASTTVVLACLTTTVTLTSTFASYLRTDLFKQKMSVPV